MFKITIEIITILDNAVKHAAIQKALIIEDEKDICYLLTNILKQKNIVADCVFTLKDAELTLDEINPEVIFLDNHLPDGMGVNFIRHIKEKCPFSNIIIVTAHDTSVDREKAMHEGADYFIGKPFSKDIIYWVLEKINLEYYPIV